jgi:hypothetical protein
VTEEAQQLAGDGPERRAKAAPIETPLDAFDLTPEAVRERFRWATRQGHPMWLWPNVTIERWQSALVGIERALRGVLTGRPAPRPLDGDSEAMSVACYTSGTGPLLGFWAKQGLVDATPAVAAVLDLHLRHNKPRMDLLTAETRDLAAAFGARGVTVTLLKGLHTAHAYFPAPETRPVSDIDLLVNPSDEAAASAILSHQGYRAGPASRGPPPQRDWRRPGVAIEPKSLGFVHADDPWAVDTQTSLDRRYSPGAPMIRLDGAATGAMREPWALAPQATVLRQPLLLLQIAIHASCGFQSLNLLRLVELALIVRRDSDAGLLHWSEFQAMAERYGALGLIYPALRLCERLVPGTIPPEIVARSRQHAPASVRHVVDRLTPANAQRVVRYSMAEKFMWTGSRLAAARQLVSDIVPPGIDSVSALFAIYKKRAWKIARQTLTR